MMESINSKRYWDERISTGDWEKNDGEKQSLFFAMIAVSAFPNWFVERVKNEKLDIVDYGCAEGAGTAYLAETFPQSMVTGVDFSEKAIETAQKKHPSCTFLVGDITAQLEQHDIVFCSNTLEHFYNATMIMNNLVNSAKQYAVIVLPFEDESGTKEHFSIFRAEFIPEKIGDHYSLIYFKEVDCRRIENTQWPGKQLILIYANNAVLDEKHMSVSAIFNVNIIPNVEDKYILQCKEEKLINELAHYQRQIENEKKQAAEDHRKYQEKIANYEAQMEDERKQAAEEHRKYQEEILDVRTQYRAQVEYGKRVALDLQECREEMKEKESLFAQYKTKLLAEIEKTSRSKAFKAAHFFVEMKYLLLGNAEDRKNGVNWLLHDRVHPTKYNYLKKLYLQVQEMDVTKYKNILIREVISQHRGKNVYVMPVLVDWNIPLFQRPQQIAMGFAHAGELFIYLTGNTYDNVKSPVMLEENLILAPQDMLKDIFENAKDCGKRIILDLYSTGHHYDLSWLNQWNRYDYNVLYEYVDEISEEIWGSEIPKSSLDRHFACLKNENIYVVATADKLYQDVLKVRSSKNTLCSGNGVDVKHFQQPVNWNLVPENLRGVLKEKKPIVGYFGAIAVWFDYDLIYEAAKKRPNYNFVLIGPQYGDLEKTNAAVTKLSKLKNIIFTGTIDYKILPNIANNFTIATIPFLLNDITESTSPIKLFEYMAMGKPVVTTAMRECLKYPDVKISHNSEEYIQIIDDLIREITGPNAAEYKDRLIQVANQNSWDEKAKEIIQLINRDEASSKVE